MSARESKCYAGSRTPTSGVDGCSRARPRSAFGQSRVLRARSHATCEQSNVLGHDVRVKVSALPDGRSRAKPEYEDVRSVAEATGAFAAGCHHTCPRTPRNGGSRDRVGSQNARRSQAPRSTQEKVMMVRKTSLVAALAVGALRRRSRQTAAAKCEIDDRASRAELRTRRTALVTAGLVGKPDEKKKQITKAIGLLTTPQANANQVGRNWLLGRALVTLASLPDQPTVAPKASLGYTGAPRIRSTSCSPRTRRSTSWSRRCRSAKRRRSSTVASRTCRS